jgi:hypothetical protein
MEFDFKPSKFVWTEGDKSFCVAEMLDGSIVVSGTPEAYQGVSLILEIGRPMELKFKNGNVWRSKPVVSIF